MPHPLSKEMLDALERGSDKEEKESNMRVYKEFYFRHELRELIKLAKEHNYVITINTVSLQPLQTGNIEMVPDVRPARGSY